MKTIISEKLPRILKNKKILEEKLNIKISNRGKEISISGKAVDEYIAEKVIDALDLGFPFSKAISIKEEGFLFEILNIKDYTTRKDLKRVRARIIGKNGKVLKTLTKLTGCFFEIKENHIGIIGEAQAIERAQEAIISIIKGTKHSNIYSRLEREKIKPVLDLGLKKDSKP